MHRRGASPVPMGRAHPGRRHAVALRGRVQPGGGPPMPGWGGPPYGGGIPWGGKPPIGGGGPPGGGPAPIGGRMAAMRCWKAAPTCAWNASREWDSMCRAFSFIIGLLAMSSN
eukprot:CAMPEP_0177612916 /NCGR_PEP_ID=MMETSP0419_2-20121207/21591_1 /TAXON_ID=582737 /ORGANISM="Tetraselmis sp., Strain GSL018" /LENGTH=112 /DNA_ID=CAMNT_0019109367 /DNA_START=81 /DNA_END=420 /DNA_ORIENTATION=+